MNPAILKALIISGGTLGVGVPGIYYGYPHIAKLISPSQDDDQGSNGKSTPVPTETSKEINLGGDVTDPEQTETPKDSEASDNHRSQTSPNGENGDTTTDPKDQAQTSPSTPATTLDNGEESQRTDNNGNTVSGTGTLSEHGPISTAENSSPAGSK